MFLCSSPLRLPMWRLACALLAVLLEVRAIAPPLVTSVFPNHGNVLGGQWVEIKVCPQSLRH